jgi:hypothetical protein
MWLMNPYEPPTTVDNDRKPKPPVDWRKVRIAFVATSAIAGIINLILMSRLERDLSKGPSSQVAIALFNAPALPIMCVILPFFPPPIGEQFLMTHEYFLYGFTALCGSILWGMIVAGIARLIFRRWPSTGDSRPTLERCASASERWTGTESIAMTASPADFRTPYPVITVRVIGLLAPGFARVIVGPGVGMLDGGSHQDWPLAWIPESARFPNREFRIAGFSVDGPQIVGDSAT